jgi:hypothetical protein
MEINAGLAGTQCFSLKSSSQSGSTATYSIAPQAGGLNACFATVTNQSSQYAFVPVVIAAQTQLGAPVSYVLSYESTSSNSTVTLRSGNPGIASVPATAQIATSATLGETAQFTITPGAVGSTVIEVYESGTSQPPTFSVPVTVTNGVPSPTPAPSPTSGPPVGNTFTLANASSQAFPLAGSPVAAQVSFFGQVTIAGAGSENVGYAETAGLPSNGCPVTGTIVDAISLTFPIAFSFAPNGSGGPTTGFLDTVFTPPSATGTYYGTIYQAGACGAPFDAATQAYSTTPTSFEYLGGGNTSVPAGTYILELWH